MGYRSVLACFALVLLAGCTFDDGTESDQDSAIARAGEDMLLDIGVARLEISRFAIGTEPGLIEPGSEVILKVDKDREYTGRDIYSPVIHVQVKDPDGEVVPSLNLAQEAVFELSYNFAHAREDGQTRPVDLALIRDVGGSVDELTFSTAPATDANFNLVYEGRVRARLTGFSRFAVSAVRENIGLPDPTALTGFVSTVLSTTTFQLADDADEFDVAVAIPTADATSPPAVLTLNDASFDDANPLDPNNRVITIEHQGTTYSSDRPAASVLFQLDTFTGNSSSGSITGTVIEQGGSQSLDINFTFTTSEAPAVALAGVVTDIGGRRAITLQDAAGGQQVLISMPDSFPNAGLDPVTFDDSTFDAGNLGDPANRIVTVTEGGDTFSSDVPVVGDVTVTFTNWDGGTLAGQGTISGTVASPSPATKELNYTFTVAAGGTGGGGSFSAGAPVDVSTDQADESAVVFDGVDYIAVWLSDTGTTNRTLELRSLDPDTLAPGTQHSFEPASDLDPAAGLHAAADAAGNVLIVGATGTDDTADDVIGVLFDYTGGSLIAEFTVGTGARPRVAYNGQADTFVVAYEASGDVAARAYSTAGTSVAPAVTVSASASLKGMAAADGVDEVLITADAGSGIVGQYVTPSTGTLSGASFDLSTSLSGGLCAWDEVGGQYIVLLQDSIETAFTVQTAVALAAGTTTPVGSQLILAAGDEPARAAGGNAGVIFGDAAANLYPVDSGAGGPALVDMPIFGAVQGLGLDVTADGAPLASAGSNRYVLLAARGADGVTAVPLTLVP